MSRPNKPTYKLVMLTAPQYCIGEIYWLCEDFPNDPDFMLLRAFNDNPCESPGYTGLGEPVDATDCVWIEVPGRHIPTFAERYSVCPMVPEDTWKRKDS